MTLGVSETVSRLPTTLCFSGISGSLPQWTKPIKLLNENAMGSVGFLDKIGARRQSVCHDCLLVGIVLGLVAKQDPVLGRSRIYVIQFPPDETVETLPAGGALIRCCCLGVVTVFALNPDRTNRFSV
jgi:hypothetical protein